MEEQISHKEEGRRSEGGLGGLFTRGVRLAETEREGLTSREKKVVETAVERAGESASIVMQRFEIGLGDLWTQVDTLATQEALKQGLDNLRYDIHRAYLEMNEELKEMRELMDSREKA